MSGCPRQKSPLMTSTFDCFGEERTRRRLGDVRRRRPASISAAVLCGMAFSSIPFRAAAAGSAPGPSRHLDRDAVTHSEEGLPIKATRNNLGCLPDQHAFLLTLYTDAHSIEDNYWEFGHASYGYGHETGNSGTFIDGQTIGSGNLGYGSVVTHSVCVDKAANAEMSAAGSGPATYTGASALVESCYDLEMRDRNGDGFTSPHSSWAGLAGGFSLMVDGAVVAEHRGRACLSNNGKEWKECAIEAGFEFCGLRVCTVGEGGGATRATVSGLGGSQCGFVQPQCDPRRLEKSSSSSISVKVDTDSYGQEVSYEVRRSSRSDSRRMRDATENDLLLAGGRPVREAGDELNGAVILGQPGVGVDLDDNESFESVACLSDGAARRGNSCYDLRVYDAYGDGMGCGASGSVSLELRTPEGVVSLTQRDRDMAKRRQVNGRKRLACLNKERLSKWSYCAVRLCGDGTVIGLEGNQCDFLLGDLLIDERYLDVDPLEGLKMKPQKEEGLVVEEGHVPLEIAIDKDEEQMQYYADEDADESSWAEYYEEQVQYYADEDANESSWAEYYESLEPGFRRDGPDGSGGVMMNSLGTAEGDYGGEETTFDAPVGSTELSQIEPNEVEQQGQEGPRPNSRLQMKIKPFSIELLDVKYPVPLKSGKNRMSSEVSGYLLSYFADNAKAVGGDASPTNFQMNCTKKRRPAGGEVRWVLDCDGYVMYRGPSPPRKKDVNNAVRDAFKRKNREKFLEAIYDHGGAEKKMQLQFGDIMEGKKQQGSLNLVQALKDSEKEKKKRKDQRERNKKRKKRRKKIKLNRLRVKNKRQRQS